MNVRPSVQVFVVVVGRERQSQRGSKDDGATWQVGCNGLHWEEGVT